MRRAWTIAASVILASATAFGQQGNTELTAILRRGLELRQQHLDEAALAQFLRAEQISHEPRVLAQIALAEQALQRWVAASRYLREALAASGDDYIVRHRAELEPALQDIERNLGTVIVTGGVQGAEVWVGNERLGTLPLREPVRLLPGSAVIEVRAAGYQPAVASVVVRAGAVARVNAALVPFVAASVPDPRAYQGIAAASVPVVVPSSPRRNWGWGTMFTGIGLLGVGTLGLVMGEAAAASYNGGGCVYANGLSFGPSYCVDRYNTTMAWRYTGYVGLGLGVVSTVVGIVLLATSPRAATPAVARRGIECGFGGSPISFACEGSF